MNSSNSPEMYSENTQMSILENAFLFNDDQGLGEMLVGRVMKPDPGIENGWNDNDELGSVLNYGNGSEFKTTTYNSSSGPESFKKRKADDEGQNFKVNSEDKYCEKKMREFAEEEGSKITEQNSNNKNTTTNANTTTTNNKKKGPLAGNSKGSDTPKPDYIHVRARRGQATDSHSLAERVRREKISERMRYLQDLVPGCNKIIGKAGMLDEIINYVQSLQTQVEFLSMKLATINPGLDFDPEYNYLPKEMFPGCPSNVPTIGVSSDNANNNPSQFQFITFTQGASSSVLDHQMNVNPRKTILQDTFLDSPCLNQFQQLTWDAEFQNLSGMEFQQGRSPLFTSQPITGYVEESHVKREKMNHDKP